jgi:hypothetical protein
MAEALLFSGLVARNMGLEHDRGMPWESSHLLAESRAPLCLVLLFVVLDSAGEAVQGSLSW